jgi:hypothetical protein
MSTTPNCGIVNAKGSTVFRDFNISAIYRPSLSVSKTCFALANQRVASTRYEKVGPRLGFAVVPRKADAGFGLPPGINVEVFVVCDQTKPVREVEGECFTYNGCEVLAVANCPEVADQSRHDRMPYMYLSVSVVCAAAVEYYPLR